jgi:hypothetical protein
MSTGPLRRAVGLLGLVALAPVLVQLAAGSLTPEDAAMRGATVAVVIVVIGRVSQQVLVRLLRRVERRRPPEEAGTAEVTGVHAEASDA